MDNWYTSKKERTFYGLYFMGQNVVYTFTYMFLATYLLLCGLDAVATAGVLLLVKVWDAVNDCLFGGLIDKFHFKNGRFIPWLKISLPLILLTTALLFRIPQSLGINQKLVFFAVAYVLWDTAYTICDVPIFGLVTTMTDIQDERTSLMTTGRIYANFGTLLALAAGYVLPSEAVGMSFSNVAVIVCVVSLVTMFWLCFRTKEHVQPEEREDEYTMRSMFTYLFHNRYLFIYYGGLLLFTGLNTATTVLQFACFYLFKNSLISTVLAALSFVPAVIVALFMPRILKKWDKFRVFYLSAAVYAGLSVVVWIVGPVLIPQLVLMTLRGIVFGAITVLEFMFTPDCAEYGQYTTGIEAKGITFAIQTFTMKLVSALSSVIAIAVLGLFGWNSVAAESFAELAALNVPQSEMALKALWAVFALIPALGAVLAVLIWHKYDLKTGDVEQMAKFNNGEIDRDTCEANLSHPYTVVTKG
ncbi:MAG: MFS transporter [Oscillospiraceae bacterium]|nr:MFS transporter [Oscillospiraceae bacterium]